MHLTPDIGRLARVAVALSLWAATCTACANGAPANEVSPPRPRPAADRPAGCMGQTEEPARLRLGVAKAGTAAREGEGFQPLALHLQKQMGIPVEVFLAEHYDDLAERMAHQELDLALLPPLAYVRARERMPCLGLLLTLVRNGDVRYSGYILVHRHGGIDDPHQLVGRRIALVGKASASGWLYPLVYLTRAGLDAQDIQARARVTGDHLAALGAVLDGTADAAASFPAAIESARRLGIDTSALRVLAITGRIPYDALVTRPGLSPAVEDRIAAALGELNATRRAGRAALAGLTEVDGFVPTADTFYDSVRETLRAAPAVREVSP